MYINPYFLMYPHIMVSYKIVINRNSKILTLYKNNQWFKSYPVAVGKKSTPTPVGNYKITTKAMNPGGPFGARWMQFKPHYGIHGTNDPSSIGKEISNGCVRMYNSDVIELYNLVPIGTHVSII